MKNESKKSKCIDLDLFNTANKIKSKTDDGNDHTLSGTNPAINKLNETKLEEKDWKSLYAAVHKMIPSFSIMGISTDFENMAKKIQEYASTAASDRWNTRYGYTTRKHLYTSMHRIRRRI